MTSTAAVFLVLSIGSVAVGLFTVFVGIPRIRTSFYRYELWRIRDELWDGVHGGVLDGSGVAPTLLARIEIDIQRAPQMRMSAALAAMAAMRGTRFQPAGLGSLSHRDLDMAVRASGDPTLMSLHARYERAVLRYLLTGSVVGWLIGVPVVIGTLLRTALHRSAARGPMETQQEYELRAPSPDRVLHGFVLAAASAPPMRSSTLALQECV